MGGGRFSLFASPPPLTFCSHFHQQTLSFFLFLSNLGRGTRLECTEFWTERVWPVLSQLERAHWERRHRHHSYGVQDRLPNQLLVVHNLSPYGRLGHDCWLAEAGCPVNLLVRDGVGDVADHRLADGHRLGVQGELLAQVGDVVEGRRVHSDMTDGLGCGRQLDWAGGGRRNVRDVLGLRALEDVVHSLDDRGVGGGRVRDNSRLHRGGGHNVSLCRDDGLGLEGWLRMGRDVLRWERQDSRVVRGGNGRD